MVPNNALGHLVEKACKHWEAGRMTVTTHNGTSTQTHPAFTITISREAGTRGTAIAHEVGKRLGWQVYDHELLERIARDQGIRTTLLESVDERHIGAVQECVRECMAAIAEVSFVTESAYVHHLIETVLALGVHGECVIVGRGVAHVLPVQTTLRVRLVAPMLDRVAVWSQGLGIPHKEGARQVRMADRERSDFIQDHFSKDPREPQNYDLVLNTSSFSIDESADVVVAVLHRLQSRSADRNTGSPT